MTRKPGEFVNTNWVTYVRGAETYWLGQMVKSWRRHNRRQKPIETIAHVIEDATVKIKFIFHRSHKRSKTFRINGRITEPNELAF